MNKQKPALAYGVKKVEYARRVREHELASAVVASGAGTNSIFASIKGLFT